MGLSLAQQASYKAEEDANILAQTSKQKNNLDLWRGAADAILSDALWGKEALNTLQTEGVQLIHFPVGRWQRLYGILVAHIQNLKDGDIVNPTEILHEWGGEDGKWSSDEQTWFYKRLDISRTGNKVFHKQSLIKNIPLLKKYAEFVRLDSEVAATLQDFRSGKISPEELVQTLPDAMQRIRQSSINVENVAVTGDQIDWLARDGDGAGLILSPSPDFNYILKGFRHGGITVTCGEQKSGKTRFVLGNALGALQGGESVAIFSLEERKNLVLRRLGAMLMSQYISEKWGDTTSDEGGVLLQDIDLDWWLTKDGIARLNHPKRKEAALVAKGVTDSWGKRLRIYDEADGVMVFSSLMGWLKTDSAAYGVPSMTVIDHTHHMIVPTATNNNSNADYLKLNHIGTPLHQHAVGTGTAMMLLAQRGVEANKSEPGAGNKLGIRGGEKLSEVALLGLIIRGQIDDNGQEDIGTLYLYARAGRFCPPRQASIAISIHGSTGRILSHAAIKPSYEAES